MVCVKRQDWTSIDMVVLIGQSAVINHTSSRLKHIGSSLCLHAIRNRICHRLFTTILKKVYSQRPHSSLPAKTLLENNSEQRDLKDICWPKVAMCNVSCHKINLMVKYVAVQSVYGWCATFIHIFPTKPRSSAVQNCFRSPVWGNVNILVEV